MCMLNILIQLLLYLYKFTIIKKETVYNNFNKNMWINFLIKLK